MFYCALVIDGLGVDAFAGYIAGERGVAQSLEAWGRSARIHDCGSSVCALHFNLALVPAEQAAWFYVLSPSR